jgi:hypothetical protein
MNNKNIRMKRKRKKRSKECEQRKPDIDNKECMMSMPVTIFMVKCPI